MTKIVETWYGENVDYNLNGNVCASSKVCGHYTQVTVILELSLHELTTVTRNSSYNMLFIQAVATTTFRKLELHFV